MPQSRAWRRISLSVAQQNAARDFQRFGARRGAQNARLETFGQDDAARSRQPRAREKPRRQRQTRNGRAFFQRTDFKSAPMCAGLRVVLTPHSSSAAILSAAAPLPPLTIAPRVSHALARRRGDAGDEADDGFCHVFFRPKRGLFFVVAADFADHHHGFGLRIGFEKPQRVQVLQAVDRVAADADASRLPKPQLRELMDCLVSEGAGARDHADRAFFVNVAGHDADFDFVRGDDAGAVGANQDRLGRAHCGAHGYHIERRNAFGDAHDDFDPGGERFFDRGGGERRRDINHRHVGAGFFFGGGDRIKNGHAFDFAAAFARRHAADETFAPASVFDAMAGVKPPGFARRPLREDARFFINENRHCRPLFWPRRRLSRPRPPSSSRRQSASRIRPKSADLRRHSSLRAAR